MKKFKEVKGITLIALVITIIILLILVGISIATLGGENGIISKTKLAKEKYKINESKEKLELKIAELQIEEQVKNETFTKEDLAKLNNNEIDVINTDSFPVKIIYGKYKFSVNENFIVTYIGEVDETIITYITNPDGYTNQDEIQILIKISNPKGIKTIEYPNKHIDNANGNTFIEIDYKVNVNGIYTFKVIDSESKEVTKDIVIEQIDKLNPIDFTPQVEKDGNTITIKTNVDDAEADEKNIKSGIDYCEYYLKLIEETEYKKYETNQITGLKTGTYELYVIAHDRARNSKKSNTIEFKIAIKMKKIEIGYKHCLGFDDKNNVYSWGRNDYGQLGNGSTEDIKVPTKISIEEENITFSKICAGYYHSLAIDNEGKLWSWGRNDYGQLGNGSTEDIKVPTKISIEEENITFSKIFAGDYYSLAIDNEGKLWTWGRNDYGQLGNATNIDSKIPKKININEGIQFSKISAGSGHNLAIDLEGNLWSWGYNNCGQLGNGNAVNINIPSKVEIDNKKIRDISANSYHSFAIDSEGNILAFGNNYNGQLGNKKEKSIQTKPQQITSGTTFCEIIAGEMHGIALDLDGNIWTWGKGGFGELGLGTITKNLYPSKLSCSTKFKEIFGKHMINFAIDKNDNLWRWGYGGYYQTLTVPAGNSLEVPTIIQ